MKTVYLIAAHYGEAQFAELVDALGDSPVFVHIDRKSNQGKFRDAVLEHEVNFVADANRVDVRWGGWSQVESTLSLMRLAQPHIAPDDHVILLSGDTYPLQSPEGIHSYFSLNPGSQYINSVSMPSVEASKPLTRMSNFYVEYDPRNGKSSLLPKVINKLGIKRNYRKALGGRTPHAGSTWWALTGEACEWILSEIDRDPAFANFSRRTKMPDEFFFQTLIENSPFASKVRRSLMFTDWSRPDGPKPAVMDSDHVAQLQASSLTATQKGYGEGVTLFGRKVTSKAVALQIQSELWSVTPAGHPAAR